MPQKNKNIPAVKGGDNHSPVGHRKRMRERLHKRGSENMSEAEILEMLLFYVVPRCDTRKLAEELICKYGSIEGVIACGADELSKTPKLKENAVVFFMLLREVMKRGGLACADSSLLEPSKLKEFLVELYRGASAETVYVLYFSEDGVLRGKQLIFRGDISSAKFSLRTITEGAIRAGGNSVVLAHNHPSGVLVPSNDDIISTRRIAAHLAANDIHLIEHYIVGNDDCVGILKV